MAGRPRSFDREVALEQALNAFWERGYDGTSIAELTATMGIAAPSLYAAFGDKRRLFDEAAAAYLEHLDDEMATAVAAPTTHEAVERILRGSAVHHTARECPRGCLVMSEPLLAEQRASTRDKIRERLRRGRDDDHDLPADADVDALADYLSTVIAGMSARSRDGATLEELDGVVDLVMAGWPTRDR